MINGGFVPYPNIKIINDRALTPVKNILEPFGAKIEQDGENQTILITKGDTEISFKIGSIQADVNGDLKELDAALSVINGEVYVPVRFVAEALGADVEYIAGLSNGGVILNRGRTGGDVSSSSDVSVISIEMPEQAHNVYSPEEGLVKVKESSAAEYQVLLDYYKLGNRTFDDNFNKDYDSQDIMFTGLVYGRYYVYRLCAFPDYNIFFNKYTGEIFSERAGLPFLNISKGFINISWMYQ